MDSYFSKFTSKTQENNIPVYIPYGNCLNKSDSNHRDAYPTSAVFGNGSDPKCIPNLIHTNKQLIMENTSIVNKTDRDFFLNQNYPQGVSQYLQTEYSAPNLQSSRPQESVKNSYISLASKSLHMAPDIEISIFFSDTNIEHLRNVVVQKVKEITADSGVAGDKLGVTIMKPNMDDFFYYMVNVYQNYKIYNGSICFIGLKNKSDIQNEISKLNTTVLQDYVSKLVSQINMYIYYYRDASQIPEQLSMPLLTSMKGSRSLEYNVGFYSGNSTGVASYNEVGNF
jgi:hypothetical protein